MENPNIYIDTNLEAEAKALCSTEKNELLSAKFDATGLKFSKDGKRLLRCKKDIKNLYVIPDGVEAICDRAFSGVYNLESIQLPDSIKYVGDFAFCGTGKLKKINFPASLQYLGEGVFGDSGLKNMDLSHTRIKTIKDYSFTNCKDLKTISLPYRLISIGDKAFHGVSCKEFVIPESVLYIGYEAIYSANLKKLVLPASVKDLGHLGCDHSFLSKIKSNSKDIRIEKNAIYNSDRSVLFECFESDGYFLIPNTVKSIKSGCFSTCADLEVGLEEGSVLEEIGDRAFSGVYARTFKFPETLKRIGRNAFEECYIDVLKLPDSLEEIGSLAFADCDSLTEIWLPSSLKVVGEDVFYNANALEYIDVPKGEKERIWKLLRDYEDKIVERDFDETLLEELEEEEDWDDYFDDWDEEDDIVEDEVEFDYMDEEDRKEENKGQIIEEEEEETDCVHDETMIEIWNDVNWKQIGFSLDSTNVEIADEYNFSFFLEISGRLKQDFSLWCALYDYKGKIRKVEWIRSFHTSNPKYEKKIDTIISKDFYLHFPVKEIRRIRLFVD